MASVRTCSRRLVRENSHRGKVTPSMSLTQSLPTTYMSNHESSARGVVLRLACLDGAVHVVSIRAGGEDEEERRQPDKDIEERRECSLETLDVGNERA